MPSAGGLTYIEMWRFMTESEQRRGKKAVRLKVSPRVAHIVAGRGGREEQLQAVRGLLGLSDVDRLTLMAYFIQGKERELAEAVRQALDFFPVANLQRLAGDTALHPGLLVFLARRCGERDGLTAALLANPMLPEVVRRDLQTRVAGHGDADTDAATDALPSSSPDDTQDDQGEGEDRGSDEPLDSEEPEVPEHLSKFQMAMQMGVAEKIKAALTGDKEWRGLLINDSNKLVSSAVLKNPRITEGEVQTLARNKATNEELIRIILLNREWVKNYSIKLALVMHPRTPMGNALRFMGVLTEKDLKNLVKSREVSPVISNNARRLLLAKSQHR